MENNPLRTATKLVKMNFELVQKTDEQSLLDYICDLLKKVDLDDFKLNADFIRYIAELIENQVKNKNKNDKIDKKELFNQILKRVFAGKITEEEIKVAGNIVEFLLKNKMVKKIPLSKVMIYFLKKKFCFV